MRQLRVLVLVRCETPHGMCVLTVKDPGSGAWVVPGLIAPEGRALPDVAAEVLERQAGLVMPLARLLAFDHAPGGHDGGPETLTVVMDGGFVRGDRADFVVKVSDTVGALPLARWSPLRDVESQVIRHAATYVVREGLPMPVLVHGMTDMELSGQAAKGGT
ncbi:hypothetical protein ACWEV4_14555 [Streptomyces sp. NPDC003860]